MRWSLVSHCGESRDYVLTQAGDWRGFYARTPSDWRASISEVGKVATLTLTAPGGWDVAYRREFASIRAAKAAAKALLA